MFDLVANRVHFIGSGIIEMDRSYQTIEAITCSFDSEFLLEEKLLNNPRQKNQIESVLKEACKVRHMVAH